MLQYTPLGVLIATLRVLAVVFLAAFLLGMLPLLLSMMGLDDLGFLERVFAFFWVTVASWFYSVGAPDFLVSTGSHIPFFTVLGYCLVYLLPALFLGAAAWALNWRILSHHDGNGQQGEAPTE